MPIFCALAVAGCATPLAPTLPPNPSTGLATRADAETATSGSSLVLRIGDVVTQQVYGRPELAATAAVAANGTIALPLVGSVKVAGLSLDKAAQRAALAYRRGYLVNPQVTLSLANSSGNQVAVLGAVKSPGRFAVDPRSTVLDALAQAGGIAENGANSVVLLRPDKTGTVIRHVIHLDGLNDGRQAVPTLALRGGDSLFVPPAEQFYILGEVKAPNMYRLEPRMTVVQAISRGGGITPRGSSSRIEIKRRQTDGSYLTGSADLGDLLQADDVVTVKERFF